MNYFDEFWIPYVVVGMNSHYWQRQAIPLVRWHGNYQRPFKTGWNK